MEEAYIQQLYQFYLEHPEVTTDSRTSTPGSIFFALKGERFDGNQYASEVLAKGCSLAVVDDASVIPASSAESGPLGYGPCGSYFLVPDVLTALQKLAAWHRQQFRAWSQPVTVIGITGTNGKTTTKELLNAVLSQRYSVLATAGNLNNQIGVPLTLLKVTPAHQLAIIEMGANHPEDIADLCAIARPDYGLITNVGKAHLLGFGSFEGVIAAKTRLYESLRLTGGKAFVDMHNEHLVGRIQDLTVIPYVEGSVLSVDPYLEAELMLGDSPIQVSTSLIGAYNLVNVIAAATVGHHFGVESDCILAALEGYKPRNMRSQLVDLGNGRQLVLDTYNANPTSMAAALQSFALNGAVHKSLILGDMRELGADSQAEHRAVFAHFLQAEARYREIVLVGHEFTQAFTSLTSEEKEQIAQHSGLRCYEDVDALCADTQHLLNLPGTILVKGSRGIQLEKAVRRLEELIGETSR